MRLSYCSHKFKDRDPQMNYSLVFFVIIYIMSKSKVFFLSEYLKPVMHDYATRGTYYKVILSCHHEKLCILQKRRHVLVEQKKIISWLGWPQLFESYFCPSLSFLTLRTKERTVQCRASTQLLSESEPNSSSNVGWVTRILQELGLTAFLYVELTTT